MDNVGHINCGIGLKLQGSYKVQVIDGDTREVIRDYPEQKNLILNSGMNGIAGGYIAYAFQIGIAGTGSRPNNFGGGTSTIYQHDDNIVTLVDKTGYVTDFTTTSASYTAIAQAGDTIQYLPDLSESMVLSVTDSDNLVVNTTYSFDVAHKQTFKVWKTSQSTLQGEASRSGLMAGQPSVPDTSYFVAGCYTQTSHSHVIHTRTWDFAKQAGSATYTEVGSGWTATNYGGTFSRTLLQTPIYVGANQRLRLQYSLKCIYSPAGPSYFTASVNGWAGSGTTLYGTQSIINMLVTSVTGVYPYWVQGTPVLEPYAGGYAFISSKSASLSGTFINQPGGVPDASYNRYVENETALSVISNVSYINNSFEMYKSSLFTVYQGNTTHIRCFGVTAGGGGDGTYTIYQGITALIDSDRPKTDIQKMLMSWKYTWSRTLSD